MITADIAHIDAILAPWQPLLADDFIGYRNHVVRMASCCLALAQCDAKQQELVEIAACFHDIGLWTDNTLDYLEPSLPPAQRYLAEQGREDDYPLVRDMILYHHALRPVTDRFDPLVEWFRQADWIDFSRGLLRFELPKADLDALVREFPNAGFHRMLVKRSAKWLVKHPLNPAPMMRW